MVRLNATKRAGCLHQGTLGDLDGSAAQADRAEATDGQKHSRSNNARVCALITATCPQHKSALLKSVVVPLARLDRGERKPADLRHFDCLGCKRMYLHFVPRSRGRRLLNLSLRG